MESWNRNLNGSVTLKTLFSTFFLASCKKVGKGGRRLADFSFGIGSRFTTLNYISHAEVGVGFVAALMHLLV
jgi:hypothetical protein